MDEKLKQKLLSYIQDMYALENQIVETLGKHVDQAKDAPDIQAKIRQHLAESEQHRLRMEQRLRAYNETPSGVKSVLSGLMGNTVGLASGIRPDPLAMNARDEYVTEHLEIASYALLIATASAYGDTETVQAAELNLRDEIAMQRWLLEQMPEVALRSLQLSGINLSPDAIAMARQHGSDLEKAVASGG